MVGNTWKAKIEPSEVLGVPSAPNSTLVPAAVEASMLFTTSPAQVMARWP